MKFRIVLLALLFGGIVMPGWAPARAADLGVVRPTYGHRAAPALPFPRSARAAAVWREDACWQARQATCTWDEAACLKVDSQGRCLRHTDACDRASQNECRTRGGPYLSLFE